MSELDLLASELGVSGRTLRRAAARGLFRCTPSTPRTVTIPAREGRYLRRHWPILGELTALLRTERNIRLAVLFGSLARGEAGAESDVDLLVRFARDDGLTPAQLSLRLSERLERNVQVIPLADAERTPLLLADVLRDGRVLVDRDDAWAQLRSRAQAVEQLARREDARLEHAAWRTLDSLGSLARERA